ncbi:MAG: hypothetical protein LUI87_07030 [Lachnospiraceae bacterium]|nr:hypothetical protein [Lachnospiraceae bacterium]
MSVLKLIYDGKIYPAEQIVSSDPAYHSALRELDRVLAELEDRLDEEDYQLVDTVLELCAEQMDYQCSAFFEYGFSLAAELHSEANDVIQMYHRSPGCKDIVKKKEDGSKIIAFKFLHE